ncbi:putative methyl-accepting chemotaxis sensory transducer [Thioalkalivibrio sulfidiphilus HL-EbGr7]|uniref:Putative methyl-accepting chemotaxis sensory transducer n=1 Tax=Thioalkalivibrio sulfidiphilus (strain HL-EbGR7) TaxID=396588 RepID=B8GP54_THISH|nr:methyl-accepting chemotaxis protein [Thioalkalivibrio sulfidiphilus]ACL73974.1 putative methyl-accepting chemotaxis sensory transducer [Thioalkalivibrio sulfidiphilus HL-EbGr7]
MKGSSSDSGLKLGINRTFAILGGLLIVFMLLTVVAFVYYTVQLAQNRSHVAEAAEQRLTSQRIATFALESAAGNDAAFTQLQQLRDEFDRSLSALQAGNPLTGVPAVPEEIASELAAVETAWAVYRANIDSIIGGREAVLATSEYFNVINESIPELIVLSDDVVQSLIAARAEPRQIYIATRQMMLAQRVQNNLVGVLEGGITAASAADRFGRDAAEFGRVLEGMVRGFPALGIVQVQDPEAQNRLREVAMLFSMVSDNVGGILEVAPQLFEIKESAQQLESLSGEMLAVTTDLETALLGHGSGLDLWVFAGYLFGALALAMLVLLGYVLYQDTRRRLAVTTEQNRRNQRAILRLLDEMTNLAEGDLTVHATVTEDITGAIADSVNYAIDALRSLVTTINQTALQVSTAAVKTQSTALRLADASNHQAREIASASSSITDMADSIEQVSRSAETSAEVAQKAVAIAGKGALTVRKTIDGMDTIREQIQETSKRIKRLGESSQEIGDIVGLINDIADQTNILALNAAIQASAAGEAGRGFAVVADEVQRLAERSANATKQIEALVKTIQADTNEAVISMEQSTANVVNGAKLALDAGDALNEIEGVSNQLADLIATISHAARQQASVAQNVSNTMNVIQEITMQTSDGTNETAVSIGNLTNLATELRKSVAGFKLPESEQLDTVIIDQEDEQLDVGEHKVA